MTHRGWKMFFWFQWVVLFTLLYVSKNYLHPPTYLHYQGIGGGWIIGLFMAKAYHNAYRRCSRGQQVW